MKKNIKNHKENNFQTFVNKKTKSCKTKHESMQKITIFEIWGGTWVKSLFLSNFQKFQKYERDWVKLDKNTTPKFW